MRQAEKEIKEFQTRIPLILDPGEKIPKENAEKFKKIKKHLSGVIFSQNEMRQDEIGRERDKRILDPNSAHTRPGGANYKKKNSKKIRKIREQLFGIIFRQIVMRQAEKERKEFQTPSPLILDAGEKIPKKNSKKIQKN